MDVEDNNKLSNKIKPATTNEKIKGLRDRLARRLRDLEHLEDFTTSANESQLQHKLWEQYNNAKNNLYNMRDRIEILPDSMKYSYSPRRKSEDDDSDMPELIKISDKPSPTAEISPNNKRKQFVDFLNENSVALKPQEILEKPCASDSSQAQH